MGIIRNAANRKIKGRIGDTTYYVSMDRQIARQALNSSNYGESARRSPSQQGRRVMWSNLVNFYKASKGWMPKAFESKSSKQTDYNRFMSANLAGARIALTKNMAAVGACVADAFIISQGSLRSIQVNKHTSHWDTDIKLGGLQIDNSTTIADFTNAVLGANNWISEGDQLSFVSYQQYLDAQSTPHVLCTAYEVTLCKISTEVLRDYLPEFCSKSSDDDVLGTGNDISLGGFAYILSRNLSGGRLQVSTQELVTNNDVLIMQYTSADAVQAAIESYGVDTDRFLDTGSAPVQKTEQPLYIDYITVNGTNYAPNSYTAGFKFSTIQAPGIGVKFSAPVDAQVQRVIIKFAHPDTAFSGSSEFTDTDFTQMQTDGSFIINNSWIQDALDPSATIVNLDVWLTGGRVVSAQFDNFNPSAD